MKKGNNSAIFFSKPLKNPFRSLHIVNVIFPFQLSSAYDKPGRQYDRQTGITKKPYHFWAKKITLKLFVVALLINALKELNSSSSNFHKFEEIVFR